MTIVEDCSKCSYKVAPVIFIKKVWGSQYNKWSLFFTGFKNHPSSGLGRNLKTWVKYLFNLFVTMKLPLVRIMLSILWIAITKFHVFSIYRTLFFRKSKVLWITHHILKCREYKAFCISNYTFVTALAMKTCLLVQRHLLCKIETSG